MKLLARASDHVGAEVGASPIAKPGKLRERQGQSRGREAKCRDLLSLSCGESFKAPRLILQSIAQARDRGHPCHPKRRQRLAVWPIANLVTRC